MGILQAARPCKPAASNSSLPKAPQCCQGCCLFGCWRSCLGDCGLLPGAHTQVPTEKADVSEFGEPKEVAFTLADKVLTAPSQEIALLGASEVGRRRGWGGVGCWARARQFRSLSSGKHQDGPVMGPGNALPEATPAPQGGCRMPASGQVHYASASVRAAALVSTRIP